MGSSPEKVIIFFGPPGVGKGTVASRLAEEFKYVFISSGDLLRENVRKETELGKQAKKIMESGVLVPDQLVTQMVLNRLDEVTGGVFLDGFPRTLNQAQKLTSYLLGKGISFQVIDLEADDQFLMERLSQRLICRNCGAIYHRINLPPAQEGICDLCGGSLYQREDDRPEIVARRLAVYHQESLPLKDYYQKKGLLTTLRGDTPLEVTLSALRKLLKNVCAIKES